MIEKVEKNDFSCQKINRREGQRRLRIRKRLKIGKPDLDSIGYTAGCPACIAMSRGQKSSGNRHTEPCRKRIVEELARRRDPRVAREVERIAAEVQELAEENRKAEDEAAELFGDFDDDQPQEEGGGDDERVDAERGRDVKYGEDDAGMGRCLE